MTEDFKLLKKNPNDKIIALAGNPNVGKSTVFNNLTGMKQHTGNWAGKTVSVAQGYAQTKNNSYVFIDIPGTYSIMAHSPEEEVARNFLCFENPDVAVIVCDASALERNLNLVLQIREFIPRCIVCLNLIDEAERKNIHIDIKKLEKKLDIPVVTTIARRKKGLNTLLEKTDNIVNENKNCLKIKYPEIIEKMISEIQPHIKKEINGFLNPRWVALKIIERDQTLISEINKHLDKNILSEEIEKIINSYDLPTDTIKDLIVSSIISEAEKISRYVVSENKKPESYTDRKLDKILTGKLFGIPVMILFLALIFYITVSGANYPSALLSDFLFSFEEDIFRLLSFLKLPLPVINMLVFGVYRVLSWVVSVMLPPMAIFFPLFTLLEDFGYLPRIAYNLDRPFKKCDACGKQALTMCMGFGCNACGVTGARIIDSKRERLLAILTNSFVPCNGRFPGIITIITIFLAGGEQNSFLIAIILTLVIIFSVFMTFLFTKLLSKTLLKGIPSSYILELPSYRIPQFGKVIVRSVFDRTLFVLGRAVMVAAPAGMIIWLFANITIGELSVLNHLAEFLNPFGKLMGLDGVILMAFILGFPANEIVIPLIIMGYMAQGTITDISSITEIKNILITNGWTITTAISTILFSLMHWPCSTTLLTIKKETGSYKWSVVAFLLPAIAGTLICIIFSSATRLFC